MNSDDRKMLVAVWACLAVVTMAGNPADHHAFPGPSPSCMLNINQPCPVPVGWHPDWALINSTAMMARASNTDNEGFVPVHQWGLATLDNRVGVASWSRGGPDKASYEKTATANCIRLKQAGLVARCGIYHNIELGLEWLESNRAVMDAAHVAAGWFLRLQNGSVFNHEVIIPVSDIENITLRQYFIDWRSADAAEYFVRAILNVTLAVDLTFTDDREGVPVEHPEVQPATGLSDGALAELQLATQSGGQHLANALAAAGRTCWDCIGGTQGERNQQPPGCVDSGGHGKGACPRCTGGLLNCSQARFGACANDMRRYCDPAMQNRGMFMAWPIYGPEAAADHNQTLAAFLIARPPVAYLGGRLQDSDWNPLFALDVGRPLGLCQEGPTGVFTRQWSKGVASLDCNQWEAHLPFATIPKN